jgi:hypothetical protein
VVGAIFPPAVACAASVAAVKEAPVEEVAPATVASVGKVSAVATVQAAALTAVPANVAVAVTAVPTATEAVAAERVMLVVVETVAEAARAGTTDKSPNPSEATATAATFFNEIVFTIFLSFSQIKEFLLSGW